MGPPTRKIPSHHCELGHGFIRRDRTSVQVIEKQGIADHIVERFNRLALIVEPDQVHRGISADRER